MQQTLFELNNRYIIISYTWKISYHAKNSAYNLFDQVVSDVTATHVFQNNNKIYVLSMAIVPSTHFLTNHKPRTTPF